MGHIAVDINSTVDYRLSDSRKRKLDQLLSAGNPTTPAEQFEAAQKVGYASWAELTSTRDELASDIKSHPYDPSTSPVFVLGLFDHRVKSYQRAPALCQPGHHEEAE